jgi:TetR/AcrR family transcriptional regulator, transcriptional repressor for nem operon
MALRQSFTQPLGKLDNIPTSRYVRFVAAKPGVETARSKLLNAAVKIIRTKGYEATTVDDLCMDAGVTKGAFFHHFASKEALGVAAAEYWNEVTGALFAQAPYHQHADPLARLLAYIDFRAAILSGRSIPEFTCLLGTMVQEMYDSSEPLREACEQGIFNHAATLEADIRSAMKARALRGFTPKSLALYTQATLQGAFILAKSCDDPKVAKDMIVHLRRYVELLFKPNT